MCYWCLTAVCHCLPLSAAVFVEVGRYVFSITASRDFPRKERNRGRQLVQQAETLRPHAKRIGFIARLVRKE